VPLKQAKCEGKLDALLVFFVCMGKKYDKKKEEKSGKL
jgi:hypothetical protein